MLICLHYKGLSSSLKNHCYYLITKPNYKLKIMRILITSDQQGGLKWNRGTGSLSHSKISNLGQGTRPPVPLPLSRCPRPKDKFVFWLTIPQA